MSCLSNVNKLKKKKIFLPLNLKKKTSGNFPKIHTFAPIVRLSG